MNKKRLALFGVLALVVIGCVLAAGCTSTTTQNTTTTSAEPVVGTWTLPNGTTVVFGNDFNGIVSTGDNNTNFTWKKTTDGKYQVDNEKGEQVIWTLDNVKGTMTNAAGMVLTKQASDTSGSVNYDEFPTNIDFYLDQNNEGSGYRGHSGQIIIGYPSMNIMHFHEAYHVGENECIGYYTKKEGGTMVFDASGNCVLSKDEFFKVISIGGKKLPKGYTLYAHWEEE